MNKDLEDGVVKIIHESMDSKGSHFTTIVEAPGHLNWGERLDIYLQQLASEGFRIKTKALEEWAFNTEEAIDDTE